MVFGEERLALGFSGEEIKRLQIGFVLGVDGDEVERHEKLVGDGLAETDVVDLPSLAVCEDDPLDPLVGCVIDCLFDVILFELQADGLDLDQESELAVNLEG